MKKNILWILAAVLCLTLALPAYASDDTLAVTVTPDPSAVNAFNALRSEYGVSIETAPTAEILDQVMAGAYSHPASDMAQAHEMAPAFKRLASVTSREMLNYANSKPLPKEQVRNAYYIALANVLRAEIMVNPASETRYQNIQIILDLFLNGDKNDQVVSETRRVIRQSMTPDHATTIAADYGLPAAFVEFIIMDDNWDNDDWKDDTDWIGEGGYAGTDDYIATDDYLGTDYYNTTDDYIDSNDYDPSLNSPNYAASVDTPDSPDYVASVDTPDSPDYVASVDTPDSPDYVASVDTPDSPDYDTPDSPDYDDSYDESYDDSDD